MVFLRQQAATEQLLPKTLKNRGGKTMPVRSANIAFSIALIIACAVFGQMALGFEDPPALVGAQVPTKVFPLISLASIGLFAAINIISYVRE